MPNTYLLLKKLEDRKDATASSDCIRYGPTRAVLIPLLNSLVYP